MTGQEKVFLIIGRSIDGWLEISTPNDEEGNSLTVPYDEEFFKALIRHLEKTGFPKEIIEEMKEADKYGIEALKMTENNPKKMIMDEMND